MTTTVREIVDFLGSRDDVLASRNGEVRGVATFEDARFGDVAWTNGWDWKDFPGSLLLGDRLAMMRVIDEFFPPVCPDPHVDGFGFEWDGEQHRRWPHIGGIRIEDNVELGARVCIDRGAIGDTVIRTGARIDNLVHIAHNCDIGEHVLIVAGTVVCGSVKIGRNAYIGANATILQKLTIGEDAFIGAGSVVTKNVPAGECWMGNPARFYKRSDEVSRHR